MNKNIRKHHRLIKVIITIILTTLGYIFNLWWLYIIAAIFLIMAIANFCPADYFEKRSQSKKKKA
jgi:uncharacterized ion transporter superfamily protein YfcC